MLSVAERKPGTVYLLYEGGGPVALLFVRRYLTSSSKCHSGHQTCHRLRMNLGVSGEVEGRESLGSDSGRGKYCRSWWVFRFVINVAGIRWHHLFSLYVFCSGQDPKDRWRSAVSSCPHHPMECLGLIS